jgi:hypothetical protein
MTIVGDLGFGKNIYSNDRSVFDSDQQARAGIPGRERA